MLNSITEVFFFPIEFFQFSILCLAFARHYSIVFDILSHSFCRTFIIFALSTYPFVMTSSILRVYFVISIYSSYLSISRFSFFSLCLYILVSLSISQASISLSFYYIVSLALSVCQSRSLIPPPVFLSLSLSLHLPLFLSLIMSNSLALSFSRVLS